MACRVLAASAVAAALAPAQSLTELRDLLRQDLQAAGYAGFLGTTLHFATEGQLSLGTLDVDDGTEITSFVVPWQREYLPMADWPRLRVALTGGYAKLRTGTADLWAGTLPGLETSVSTRYEAYALEGGLGPVLPLPFGLAVVPEARLGVAWLDNEALYGGPGAAVTASLVDGILFDWQEPFGTLGGGCAVEHRDLRFGSLCCTASLRWDWRQTEVLGAADAALEGRNEQSWWTANVVAEAATASPAVVWQATAAVRRFERSAEYLLGFRDLAEVGAALVVRRTGWSALAALRLHAAVQFGPDVQGWSCGLGMTF